MDSGYWELDSTLRARKRQQCYFTHGASIVVAVITVFCLVAALMHSFGGGLTQASGEKAAFSTGGSGGPALTEMTGPAAPSMTATTTASIATTTTTTPPEDYTISILVGVLSVIGVLFFALVVYAMAAKPKPPPQRHVITAPLAPPPLKEDSFKTTGAIDHWRMTATQRQKQGNLDVAADAKKFGTSTNPRDDRS